MQQEPTMDWKEKIIELTKQMGLIRPRDVKKEGLPREYLLRMYRNGDLTCVAE
jgi:hypothetical protein